MNDLWGARSRVGSLTSGDSVGQDPGVLLRLLYLIFGQMLGLVNRAAQSFGHRQGRAWCVLRRMLLFEPG